ncbi:hypothetical protein, partial [Pseudarthrobacter sp. PvP022]|uniref:hypothetical protein n=1 Tax=Pseudarthrobacter sp. PvP022 TaxID=3156433 RepID=UPI003399E418
YQQTWHTIEFSNNRHTRHHHNIPAVDRSGATSQTYLNSRLKANQRFRDLPVIETIPAFEPHAKWRTVFRLFRRGFGRLR